MASCISPSSKDESRRKSASFRPIAVAFSAGVAAAPDDDEGASAAGAAAGGGAAPSSFPIIANTSFIAKKIERSSSRASAAGCTPTIASRKAATLKSVWTTTLTKHEYCPVLFSSPGAAAGSIVAAPSSSPTPLAAASFAFGPFFRRCRFPPASVAASAPSSPAAAAAAAALPGPFFGATAATTPPATPRRSRSRPKR